MSIMINNDTQNKNKIVDESSGVESGTKSGIESGNENMKFLQELYETLGNEREDIFLIAQLVKRRKELNMSREILSEKTSIPVLTILRMERLQTVPKLSTLITIAESLGMKLKLEKV